MANNRPYKPHFWSTGDVILLDRLADLENTAISMDIDVRKILLTYELMSIVLDKKNDGKVIVVRDNHLEAVDVLDAYNLDDYAFTCLGANDYAIVDITTLPSNVSFI
jgi:hypothetical protein